MTDHDAEIGALNERLADAVADLEVRDVRIERLERGRAALHARIDAAEGYLRALGYTMRCDLTTDPPTYTWETPGKAEGSTIVGQVRPADVGPVRDWFVRRAELGELTPEQLVDELLRELDALPMSAHFVVRRAAEVADALERMYELVDRTDVNA